MKKGFTLIELLAVIALIATPMILNVIETSKVRPVIVISKETLN